MGRPISIQPDDTVLWDLAFLGFCDRHIAQTIGCHQSLISKRPDICRVLEDARHEAAVAITQHWTRSSQGATRPAGRIAELVELIKDAQRRKIRRMSA